MVVSVYSTPGTLRIMKTIFSFEVFPPKKTMPIDTIYNTLDELKDLHPDFISVTFGAGGSENCDNAVGIAKRIKDVCNVKSVIHMPCLNMTKNDATFVLEEFQKAGIENILALRGDKVEGKEPANEFLHASTFSILPQRGRIAWKRLSRPCFALPPAESPSTI